MKEYFSKENNIPILTLKILTHFKSQFTLDLITGIKKYF